MEHETIDIADEPNIPSQQHNVNGEGALENELTKFVPITALLEMAASRLGVLACGWAMLVLVQGGMVFTLQTKDCVSVTVISVFICFRYWPYFFPQATGSLSEASQSSLANNLRTPNDMQQLAIPICFINRFIHWFNLVSSIICAVISVMRLASQNYGQTDVANMANRNFVLNFYYFVVFTRFVIIFLSWGFGILRVFKEALIQLAKKVKSNNFLCDLSTARSNRTRRRCCKSKQKLQKLQKLYCRLMLSFSIM